MSWLIMVLGAALIALALLDIFHTLWHPRGFGGGARSIFTVMWKLTRPLSRGARSSELSGPVAVMVTVAVWTVMTVLGWALIYLPHLPDGFNYGTALDPQRSSDLLTAVYVSTVVVATLGLGDIAPATDWLRLILPLQALVGFVLLSATISWMLQLYPALGRRRALARRLSALTMTRTREVVADGEVSVATALLNAVTEGVIQVQVDLMQYAESYFFREERPVNSFAATALVLLDLADAGEGAQAPEVRHSAEVLSAAIDELVATLRQQYKHLPDASSADAATVLRLMAQDHQHEPLRLAGS
jgi:hypothetical protein